MNPTPEKKSSGRGCFLYGCLSLVILFVLVITVTVLFVRSSVRNAIAQYTEASPRQFEAVTLTEEESQALQERLQGFTRALEQTNEPASLSLDSRELNSVISREPALSDLKDTLRVQLDGNEVRCLISIPLDGLAEVPFLGGLKGRYLNATANVRVLLENGLVATRLEGATVNGQEVPAQVLAEIEKNIRWQEIQQDPKVQALINKIDWLKIENSRVNLGRGEPGPAGP